MMGHNRSDVEEKSARSCSANRDGLAALCSVVAPTQYVCCFPAEAEVRIVNLRRRDNASDIPNRGRKDALEAGWICPFAAIIPKSPL